jgi:hypothetical protein
MTDHLRNVPVEDYGGDDPDRQPAPAADAPDWAATEAAGTLPASEETLEDAPVQGYGGNRPTTAGDTPES